MSDDDAKTPRLCFGEDAAAQAASWLDARGARRPLILCGPSRRGVEAVSALLGHASIGVFDGARVHVPREVVDAAKDAVLAHRADALITIGGGSATGLGKALRLELPERLPFVAFPTTYSASEMTNIHGITTEGDKRTGRDDGVRPDLVAYVPALLAELPPHLTVQSLLNALAQPVSALSTGKLGGEERTRALAAVTDLFRVIDQLSSAPARVDAREASARAVSRAGAILDRAEMGEHHRVAHRLGGRLDLPHAAVHAILLPQFLDHVRETAPPLFDDLRAAMPDTDPLALLHDALSRVAAPSALSALGVSWEQVRNAIDDLGEDTVRWVENAMIGRRPSLGSRREQIGDVTIAVRGAPLAEAERIIVAVHGRGSNAESIAQRAREISGDAPGVAILAPQAPGGVWYEPSYRTPASEIGQALVRARTNIEQVLAHAKQNAPHGSKLFLFGFSQGGCLALHVLAHTQVRLAGVIALGAAHIGPQSEWPSSGEGVRGLSVLVGAAEHDPWLVADDIERTAAHLRAAGAVVELVRDPGEAHELSARQRAAARRLLCAQAENPVQHGFGNAHASEALPGALPLEQNTPRRAPYGLFPEQINGTGFVAPRAHNLRTWMYRIRPSAGAPAFARIGHHTFNCDFVDRAPEPSLAGWRMPAIPEAPTDFVDGIHTVGGAGSPMQRRGFALHVYVANRSMEHRSFHDADGDLLVVPHLGRLTLRTELGLLEIGPGEIAILPRGIKFSVHLHDSTASGWVGEVYGRHFELPERGPVGANGLADPRHFRAPTAWFEDRPEPGHRVTHKLGGHLYETTIAHSPYDVVAWHGNYVPYAYDLSCFSPSSNVRVDHADPSIYLALTTALDEQGSDALDFLAFPPRWDPTEHTFRPPFFHRNVITEFNGIVREPDRAPPFGPGAFFLTPPLTPHGVLGEAVERAIEADDAQADAAVRMTADALWFQFESVLPMSLSSWAENGHNRVRHWPEVWGHYRRYYDPERPDFGD